MSDPESTITDIDLAFGSLRRAGASVVRAPKKQHPGGRDKCLLSSITGLSMLSCSWACIVNELLLISLESFLRVLRLIEGGVECFINDAFNEGASEYGLRRF